MAMILKSEMIINFGSKVSFSVAKFWLNNKIKLDWMKYSKI